MRRVLFTMSALTACLVNTSLYAGGAGDLTYTDETATRLIVDSQYGLADVEEKDYAWGDVDQDGDIDLVCVRKEPWNTPGRRRNVLFMNEGVAEGHAVNGVLVDRSIEYASDADDGGQGFLDLTNDRDVVLIDLDGDGWLDMVTATVYGQGLAKSISHPRVYRNKGSVSGAWQGFVYEEARTPQLPLAPNFAGVGVGDVSGDGSPDLYFVDYLSDLEDRLWINDGSGSFTDESTLRMTFEMLESEFGVHAVIADMNHDGHNDIVKDRALVAPIRVSISYNDGATPGFFDDFETAYLGSSYHVEVGDLNGDGLLDMVIDDDGIDRYLLNQGNGLDGLAEFDEHLFPPDSDSFGGNIVIRDLDQDGHNEVIIADVDVDCCGCSRHAHIWRSQGESPVPTFVEMATGIPDTARTGTHDVAVFDLDGDGWLDLVFGTCTGMSIWIAQPPIDVEFSYPDGRPDSLVPGEVTVFTVAIDVAGSASTPIDAVTLRYAIDGGSLIEEPLAEVGSSVYRAVLPPIPCPDRIDYSFSVSLTGSEQFTDPPSPESAFSALAASGDELIGNHTFENDASGWSIVSESGLTGGTWQRAIPSGSWWEGALVAPEADAGGGPHVWCMTTENEPPGAGPTTGDVDGGPTRLVSPEFDFDGADGVVSYDRWVRSILGTGDLLVVEVSGGADVWTEVEVIGDFGPFWTNSSFVVSEFINPTATTRVRFSISDTPNDSITEAAIDNVHVVRVGCGTGFVRGDCNADGGIDVGDPVFLLSQLFSSGGPSSCSDACDANDDGQLDLSDAVSLLSAQFGAGPEPTQPYPGCGIDPSDDGLDCDSFIACP